MTWLKWSGFCPLVLHVMTHDFHYCCVQPRFLKLGSCSLSYEGPTHELLITSSIHPSAPDNKRLLDVVAFAKQEGAYVQILLEQDERLLRQYLSQHRTSATAARWYFYLGMTLDELGKKLAAAAAFEAASTSSDLEQAAWALYQAGYIYHYTAGNKDKAMELLRQAHAFFPAMHEAPWLLSYWLYYESLYDEAVVWGQRTLLAADCHISNSSCCSSNSCNAGRKGYRDLFKKLNTSPFDVLRFAYRQLGDGEAADKAELGHNKAIAAQAEAAVADVPVMGLYHVGMEKVSSWHMGKLFLIGRRELRASKPVISAYFSISCPYVCRARDLNATYNVVLHPC